MKSSEHLRIWNTIVSNLQVGFNRSSHVIDFECSVEDSPSDYLRITQVDPNSPMIGKYYDRHFRELLLAIRRIPFTNFTVNDKPYVPGALTLQRHIHRDDIDRLNAEKEALYFYYPRNEWYCYRHSQRFKKIHLSFTARPIPCVRCIEEISSLKRKYRSVCSGCRNNYYNYPQDGSRGAVISKDYACWYLGYIKGGKCPMKE